MNKVQQILALQEEAAAAQMALIKLQIGRELGLTEAEWEALPDGDFDSILAEARKVEESKADQWRHQMARKVGLQHGLDTPPEREKVVVVRSGASGAGGRFVPGGLKGLVEDAMKGRK